MSTIDKSEKLTGLIDGVHFILSNKVKVNIAPAMFAGIVYEIILNKQIIPKNADLPSFINENFIYTFNKTNENNIDYFKEYVFKSRTAVAARISRLIIEKFSTEDIRITSEWLIPYIKEIRMSSSNNTARADLRMNQNKRVAKDLNNELVSWIKR
ncbi:hypothetical protein [Weissella viridescens]|jgi:hypothetical protein|uniref:hypothetical protein n=1 Tax=Weissella viridescens TaxID=1629 RepID=UPI0022E246FD|nr:hypothetical protein [Weissella viridescens]